MRIFIDSVSLWNQSVPFEDASHLVDALSLGDIVRRDQGSKIFLKSAVFSCACQYIDLELLRQNLLLPFDNLSCSQTCYPFVYLSQGFPFVL